MLGRTLRLAAVTLFIGTVVSAALAQAQNLEAGKSPSQLFAGTCNACHKTPRGLLKTVSAGSLPGFLDRAYRAHSKAVCLTGNCQMALIWLRLYERTGDATLLTAAFKAIDEVKQAQDLDNPNPGIRGGIPGSFPIWGEYITNAIPNWAAKYFIDALLAKQKTLSNLSSLPANGR